MLIVAAAAGAWGQQTDTYITVKVKFSPEGYATYYDSNHNIVLPAGMKAYVVTDVSQSDASDIITLTYELIADGDGDVVPAGTAVLLQTVPSTDGMDIDADIRMTDDDNAAPYSGSNYLRGFDEPHLTEGGDVYYKLSYGDGIMSGTFGWYWGEENGEAFESTPHKAFLALPAYTSARFLALPDFDETSGIASATLGGGFAADNAAWFTLDGRRLNAQPANAGIYIRRGKKVAIK